ncbi:MULTISPECIES: BTAD domain-containing putative transcriptional regulator [Mesorhizobium]|uniref:BTAD domain-containing putative transcriptional regulator n=1 Tax=Mesorhizobium TaxID=68287 RepID=UPI00145A002D|nr:MULTISPECIES: BTAD domain-containing putative transcriptional regulator [Mesorhizobium]
MAVEKVGGTIRLLGEPAILDANGQSQPVRGHQAWALLARVVLARAPLDRRALAADLFPETVDPLGSLRWCLASLRKALNSTDCLYGDPIEGRFAGDLDIDALRLDRDDFDIEAAGPLLGTLEPRCSPEFATWLLVERERIAGIVEARIRQETIRAMSVEDHGRATRLAELGVRRNPYDEGAHILLVKSLALAGRYQAALDHVEATEAMFVAELGEKPSAALRSAARRTISSPPSGISRQAFVTSLMQSGLAALAAGAVDAGIDCLRRAVRDAEKHKDAQLTARAMFELGTALVHSVKGYDDEGSVLLRQSTELARQAGSAAIASAGFRELGYVEALAGRRPSAATYLSQALELAAGGENLSGIHGVIGFNLVDWGRVGEGLDHYALSLEHARSAGNRRREIWSLGLGGWGLLAADRLEEADRWLEDCLALVEEQRWISFRPWPVAVLSESRTRQQAHPDDLRPRLEEAFALSCQMNDPCWEGAVARALALTYAAQEAFVPAMEWLGEALRRCMRDTDSYAGLQVEILASQVDVNLKLDRPETADAIAREWLALAARTHRDAHVVRAAAFIAQRN